MDISLVAQYLGRFAEIVAYIFLLPDPVEIPLYATDKIDLRLIACGADAGDITRQVAHFSWAKFAFCFGSNLNVERVGDVLGDFADRNAVPTADIYRKTIEFVRLGREQVRAGDVFNEGEVASLLTIFVEDGWQIVEQTRAKNRDDASVGVEATDGDRRYRSTVARRWGCRFVCPTEGRASLDRLS